MYKLKYNSKRWRCPSCGSLAIRKRHKFNGGYRCAGCRKTSSHRIDMSIEPGVCEYNNLVDLGIRKVRM